MTDANLALGYLADGAELAGVRLDGAAAERALTALGDELGLDPVETAAGIVRIANREMVGALRVVTVERGLDPRRHALLSFGGAGGLHAAAIAAELGIERVLCPLAAGVLSAFGLTAGEPRRDLAATLMLGEQALTDGSAGRAVAELGKRVAGELSAPVAGSGRGRLRGPLRGPVVRARRRRRARRRARPVGAGGLRGGARAPLRLPRP